MDFEADVRAFHRRFGQPMHGPRGLYGEELVFRLRLLREEFYELQEALLDRNARDILGECVDLAYVAIGTAVQCGLPFAEAWKRIHEANMAKSPNPGGKPLKPEGWKPADLGDLA